MEIKDIFAKKLSFQQSLKESENWNEQRFKLYEYSPVKATNDMVMLGFIRHNTIVTEQQKEYLANKVGIPVGIQQKWELKLENHLRDFWQQAKSSSKVETQSEIINEKDEMPIFPMTIGDLLKNLYKTAGTEATEVQLDKNSNQVIISELDMIDLYSRELKQSVNSYKDLLDFLEINNKIKQIIISESKNRYFVLPKE